MFGPWLTGCDAARSAAASPGAVAASIADFDSDSSGVILDLGLVDALSDHRVYLPLKQMGIPGPAQIESTAVSCECVDLRIAEYLTRSGSWQPALCIEIFGESSVAMEEMRPVDLAVEGTLQLKSGQTRQLTIGFTHTPIKSEPPSPALAGGTAP